MLEQIVNDIEPLLDIYKTTFGWDGITQLTPESFGEEPSYSFTETELNAYMKNEMNKFKISFFNAIQKIKITQIKSIW